MLYLTAESNGLPIRVTKEGEEAHKWLTTAVLSTSKDVPVGEDVDRANLKSYEITNANVVYHNVDGGDSLEPLVQMIDDGIWPIIVVHKGESGARIVSNIFDIDERRTMNYKNVTLDPQVFPNGASDLMAMFEM